SLIEQIAPGVMLPLSTFSTTMLPNRESGTTCTGQSPSSLRDGQEIRERRLFLPRDMHERREGNQECLCQPGSCLPASQPDGRHLPAPAHRTRSAPQHRPVSQPALGWAGGHSSVRREGCEKHQEINPATGDAAGRPRLWSLTSRQEKGPR
uniref:Uncharacterized protein n=1 Tax=Buteo japonicus TaxID=224669 RepID=A0A8C0HQF1_9AVES